MININTYNIIKITFQGSLLRKPKLIGLALDNDNEIFEREIHITNTEYKEIDNILKNDFVPFYQDNFNDSFYINKNIPLFLKLESWRNAYGIYFIIAEVRNETDIVVLPKKTICQGTLNIDVLDELSKLGFQLIKINDSFSHAYLCLKKFFTPEIQLLFELK